MIKKLKKSREIFGTSGSQGHSSWSGKKSKNLPKNFCEKGLGGASARIAHRVGQGRGAGAPLFMGGPTTFCKGAPPHAEPGAPGPSYLRNPGRQLAFIKVWHHVTFSGVTSLASKCASLSTTNTVHQKPKCAAVPNGGLIAQHSTTMPITSGMLTHCTKSPGRRGSVILHLKWTFHFRGKVRICLQ